jgi:HEAT repeat protein
MHLGQGSYRLTGLIPELEYDLRIDPGDYPSLKFTGQSGERLEIGSLRAKPIRTVADILPELAAEDSHRREGACRELGNLGAEAAEAVPALIHALNMDSRNGVRYTAAEALGKIGPKADSAVPHLIRALCHDRDGVPREAARALGRIGNADAVKPLTEALSHGEMEARKNAAIALGDLGLKAAQAVSALILALDDDYKYVPSAAAESLGRIGPEARTAIPHLVRLVQSRGTTNSSARANAAKTLGLLGDPAAIPALRNALQSDRASVLRSAALALRQLAPKQKREADGEAQRPNRTTQREQVAVARLRGLGVLVQYGRQIDDSWWSNDGTVLSPLERDALAQHVVWCGGTGFRDT